MPNYDTAATRLLRTLSLDALRGFEAAARQLSFTVAAEELCLTQSAVSKQVKTLEEAIGKPLFVRGPRSLSLTSDGRRLYEGTRDVLRQLEQTLDQLVASERKTVAVTVTPSFASLWLAPKLAAFRQRQPSIDIRVDASETNVALEREGFDLAVRLARPGHANSSWRRLMQERVMLVAAPALAARVGSPADLPKLPLLVFHHPVERFPWMSWSHWYERLGLTPTAAQPVFQFSQYEHVVKSAIEGGGVAIGRTPLVLPQLRAGMLQVVAPEAQADGLAYHLVMSERSENRPEVLCFADWIERELAADALG